MSIFVDLTGRKIGRLLVLEKAGSNGKRTLWKCRCDCGNEIVAKTDSLTMQKKKSCGCLAKEIIIGNKYRQTHGQTHTRLYQIWNTMKQRCLNKSCINHNTYYDKKIQVCDEWQNDFQAFYDWAMANGYNDTLTIDRIDNNGNYEPSNCRWVTMKAQQNNRSNNHIVTFRGETHTIAEWAEIKNIPPKTLYARINDSKWEIERALTTPLLKHNKNN